ncbi:type 1 glutamine amidotransferase [SCandidatus Aminicenantes bacterium Aminicenantia_JdfR_composite]|jgi:GMP synthase-like glutamine amidotransferase|nr:type 1 glutamine amidotransferase [SCandidatus Aminicenantes bacterium Aminicenantia_JdfR_composite]
MTKVALIDNSINHIFYNPVIHWKPFIKSELTVYRAINGELPDLNGDFSHIILTGSEYSILEKSYWVSNVIHFVENAIKKGIPILGSCFGHQLIIVAIFGYKYVRRRKKPELGWIEIKIHDKNEIFRGIDDRVFAFSSHFDEVFNLPSQFKILASSEECEVQAFQYRDNPIWGIQFHPEINIKQGKELLSKGKIYHPEYANLYEEVLNSPPRDSEITLKIIENFLNHN